MSKIQSLTKAKLTLSKAEKIGQFFMPAAFINDTEKEIQQLEKLISEQHIGGLCFFHSRASAATNFEGKKKVVKNENSFETLKALIERYQKAAKYPLLIAIDAEWGLAMRIENTPQYPYAITLGANTQNSDLVFAMGKNIAKDCKAAGIHWNLAPVVDINNNRKNPVIGYRSFGDDKDVIIKLAKAYLKGMESEGVLTSIKHFPGHGDTATDSHLGLPIIKKSKSELLQNELLPFQKLINEGVDSVMVGHLSVPSLTTAPKIPSSINKEIITGLLRKEMGFNGVIISDALNMYAVSKNYPEPGKLEWLAFDAGNDILCFAEHIETGIQTILNNATDTQIETSFERIWKLKEKALNATNVTTSSRSSLTIKSQLAGSHIINTRIAEQSITLYKGTENTIRAFRKSDFCTLTFKRYNPAEDQNKLLEQLETMKKEVKDEIEILLLLTPPQVKPTNNFGFLPEEIQFINTLLLTKKVVLYHFGNPYALSLFEISKSLATVIVYQSLKEFETVATEHFLGKLKAVGKLPVKIH